jgi:hypothetical protein
LPLPRPKEYVKRAGNLKAFGEFVLDRVDKDHPY